jgi:hypothetical protein
MKKYKVKLPCGKIIDSEFPYYLGSGVHLPFGGCLDLCDEYSYFFDACPWWINHKNDWEENL